MLTLHEVECIAMAVELPYFVSTAGASLPIVVCAVLAGLLVRLYLSSSVLCWQGCWCIFTYRRLCCVGRAVGASFEAMNVEQICRQARRLGGKPARICQREPEIVEQVARGTNSSLEWCAMEFETERWNCASHSPRQRAALKNTLSLSE